jgi:hypothetical protein
MAIKGCAFDCMDNPSVDGLNTIPSPVITSIPFNLVLSKLALTEALSGIIKLPNMLALSTPSRQYTMGPRSSATLFLSASTFELATTADEDLSGIGYRKLLLFCFSSLL